jgi:hypothetical protein
MNWKECRQKLSWPNNSKALSQHFLGGTNKTEEEWFMVKWERGVGRFRCRGVSVVQFKLLSKISATESDITHASVSSKLDVS